MDAWWDPTPEELDWILDCCLCEVQMQGLPGAGPSEHWVIPTPQPPQVISPAGTDLAVPGPTGQAAMAEVQDGPLGTTDITHVSSAAGPPLPTTLLPVVESAPPKKPSSRRMRTVYTSKQRAILAEAFRQNRYPSHKERLRLSEITGIPEDRIQVWYQNRRSRCPASSGRAGSHSLPAVQEHAAFVPPAPPSLAFPAPATSQHHWMPPQPFPDPTGGHPPFQARCPPSRGRAGSHSLPAVQEHAGFVPPDPPSLAFPAPATSQHHWMPMPPPPPPPQPFPDPTGGHPPFPAW